ncbi:unnamed protein product [Ectocarpus sp. 12 AP-2014]
MRTQFFTLLLAVFGLSTMAAAVADSEWVMCDGAFTRTELQPQPAVRGRAAFERMHLAAKPISMECVDRKKKEASDGGRATRTVFLPVDRARVKHAAGDGSCGYHSIRGGLLGCRGQVHTPHGVDAIKTALVSRLLRHVLGTEFDPEATLEDDEVTKGKDLGLTEIKNCATGKVIKGQPKGELRCDWFEARVNEKIEKEWLDVSWLAFIADLYEVNIAVWEPTGSGENVQLYSAASARGLFLFDKAQKMDEAGDYWIHLLFRNLGDPWAARSGVNGVVDENAHDRNNHFDWLELGADAAASFEDKSAEANSSPRTRGRLHLRLISGRPNARRGVSLRLRRESRTSRVSTRMANGGSDLRERGWGPMGAP